MLQVEKSSEKKVEKGLTKEKRCDNINKLSERLGHFPVKSPPILKT